MSGKTSRSSHVHPPVNDPSFRHQCVWNHNSACEIGGESQTMSWLRRRATHARTYDASSQCVEEALQAFSHASVSSGADSEVIWRAGIPTEYLAADHAALMELSGDASSDSRLIKLMVKRPACLIASVWVGSLLFAFLLFAFGELSLSTSAELFINQHEEDVVHSALSAVLYSTDASHDTSWQGGSTGRRSLGQLADRNNGRRLTEGTCPGPRWSDITFSLVYEARDGGSVLRPKQLQEILLIELELRAWMRASRVCSVTQSTTVASDADLGDGCSCRPLNSVVNYVFPSVQYSGTPNASLLLDGMGYGPAAAQVGLKCGTALTSAEVQGVLSWLDDKAGFFSDGSIGANDWDTMQEHAGNNQDQTGSRRPRSNGTARSAKYLRTLVPFSSPRWYSIAGSGSQAGTSEVLGLTDVLDRVAGNPHVRVYSDFTSRWWTIRNQQIQRWLVHDVLLLLVAVLLIFAYMCVYFRAACFAFLSVMQIVLSFPFMLFIVDVLLRQRPLSAFSCCSLWVVTGVGADNIFVFHETWSQSRSLRVGGRAAPLERRVWWTIVQAAKPLLIADVTTAFALLINCISPITAIFQFGLCGGVLILANFMLVMLHMPALLVLAESGRIPCCCFRSAPAAAQGGVDSFRSPAVQEEPMDGIKSIGRGTPSLWRAHAVHGAIFRWRAPLVLALTTLSVLLLPKAILLTTHRQGGDFAFFGESSDPPPTGIEWYGATYEYGPSRAAYDIQAEVRPVPHLPHYDPPHPTPPHPALPLITNSRTYNGLGLECPSPAGILVDAVEGPSRSLLHPHDLPADVAVCGAARAPPPRRRRLCAPLHVRLYLCEAHRPSTPTARMAPPHPPRATPRRFFFGRCWSLSVWLWKLAARDFWPHIRRTPRNWLPRPNRPHVDPVWRAPATHMRFRYPIGDVRNLPLRTLLVRLAQPAKIPAGVGVRGSIAGLSGRISPPSSHTPT